MGITLRFLTVVGEDRPAATVSFGDALTVVRGPSDTGKSFIVDTIDFVLGAGSLREIPQSAGYHTALLAMTLPDGRDITLARALSGGRVGLYDGHLTEVPEGPADRQLAGSHSADNDRNVSRFLLAAVGLDERRVRRNVRNTTDSLSFRNVANLCIIDEIKMQSETAPPLTDVPSSRTKDASVLKLLLQGEDDSHLTEVPAPAELSRLRGAKFEVIDRLIGGLEGQLPSTSNETDTIEQLSRLNRAIDQQTESLGALTESRNRVLSESAAADSELSELRRRFEEGLELRARFNLLAAQYESDLARLETIGEAGTVLGFFEAGDCPLCGAAPEHRQLHVFSDGSAGMVDAARIEASRTQQLRGDLAATISDLMAELQSTKDEHDRKRELRSGLRSTLDQIEEQLRPDQGQIRQLIRAKTDVERIVGIHRQISDLVNLRAQVADENQRELAEAASELTLTTVAAFSEEIRDRLVAWGVPESENARFDKNDLDIILGDQLRSSHGKGVRAVLHAAFTLALARYCYERELPHPGFVILDSPLVTYRGPDSGDASDGETVSIDVAAAFFDDVQAHVGGQVIVMENTGAVFDFDTTTSDIKFTKSNTGRYGFYSARNATTSARLG